MINEFIDAFEEVFDRDWPYTKEMLGIWDQTDEQKKMEVQFGLESMPIIADDGTFIHPKIDDEVENWGNRARLLEAYRAIKAINQ